MENRKLRFGVNYVPSKKWWYCWGDFDRKSVEEDFEAITALGMDHIRMFCIWPVFQPNTTYVSEHALELLKEMLDIADNFRLDVCITVLTSFLSGFGFLPSWHKKRNMFADTEVICAERLLFKSIKEKVANHPRFLGFDLGNELNAMGGHGNTFTLEEGDPWQTEMLQYCQELAPGKLNVNGVGQMPWFKNIGFSREVLANTGAATVLHAYILFTGAISLYKPMETGCLHLLEYMIELAKAYSKDVDRPIWFQETGVSKHWLAEEVMPDFAEQSIRNAITCENLWGITWWCSHDISQKYSGFDQLEYDLGLLDVNNHIKPLGRRICGLVNEFKSNPVKVLERPVALVLKDEIFSGTQIEKPLTEKADRPGWNFGRVYMDYIDKGIRPAVVLDSRVNDSEYLKARGIKELVFI